MYAKGGCEFFLPNIVMWGNQLKVLIDDIGCKGEERFCPKKISHFKNLFSELPKYLKSNIVQIPLSRPQNTLFTDTDGFGVCVDLSLVSRDVPCLMGCQFLMTFYNDR